MIKIAKNINDTIEIGNTTVSTEEFCSIVSNFAHCKWIGLTSCDIQTDNEFEFNNIDNAMVSCFYFYRSFDRYKDYKEKYNKLRNIVKAIAKNITLKEWINKIFISSFNGSDLKDEIDLASIGIKKDIFIF